MVALDLEEASDGILPSAEVGGIELCSAQEEGSGLLAALSHPDGVCEMIEGAAIFGIASNIGGVEGEIASPMGGFEGALEGSPKRESKGGEEAKALQRHWDGSFK